MKTFKIAVLGASGHARVVADLIKLDGRFELVGFLDSISPQRIGENFSGSTILGGEEQLNPLLSKGVSHLAIAIGDCNARLRWADKVRHAGFATPVLTHPTAAITGDVTLGHGTVVMAGAVINAASKLGTDVIVNTGASIDHDCCVEDGVHIAPGARLAGDVKIGKASFIGMGSLVKEKIVIGSDVLVGAGSLVLNNLPSQSVAYGHPARVIRTHA